ncbi:uridine diphosphate-N-acetylglucosamine-binding protein YvcK [Muribacter muris]|uniref:Putative gluconeogenesis factor n=2 Tax=Muribacter muris TaxID=67855 RepID=A0A4Y9K3A3_9PAST|nr:uridine diphosphate-N-acetylglucosamine-binding protein YvcK [Muribacter muris]MBF0784433.1 uridine diphosphate-N-acetylglucosamine-binding protein YvcK [Muribacter muris]MBF0827979.1 uridine diphosphate-N-acetylglucosamine-binding protein YvcK [Muribacter muris]TFV12228.1 uridine diphosphate-N-acetylglucosamine-binding protein YvcK [Muribacter muris]
MLLQQSPRHPNLHALNKVVALGGGHGLGRLLSSLAFLKERLTGIVATTDNGGSTGRIRHQHGGIAWGDLRNCLTQIIVKPTVASALFEYRFGGNGELSGHNLGNLILKALEDMRIRPLEALNLVRDLLKVRVGLMPMSESPVHLSGRLSCGEIVLGEVSIDALTEVPQEIALTPEVSATPEVIDELKQAELIILGPGSFFTSIMPCLLVKEIAQTIRHSQAKVIFIDNIGKEHGMAGSLSLPDRIKWLEKSLGFQRLNGVITTPNETATLPDHIITLRRALQDDVIHYRHDRYKLSKAVDTITAHIR